MHLTIYCNTLFSPHASKHAASRGSNPRHKRGGSKRSFVMPCRHVTAKNLRKLIALHVAPGSEVHTDESKVYAKVRFEAKHRKVNHNAKEYARKDSDGTLVSTNSVESSFSLLRRGLIGTFHHVGVQHLHRYVAEFDFRWNHRKTTDGERTVVGLKKAAGKRLTYDSIKG